MPLERTAFVRTLSLCRQRSPIRYHDKRLRTCPTLRLRALSSQTAGATGRGRSKASRQHDMDRAGERFFVVVLPVVLPRTVGCTLGSNRSAFTPDGHKVSFSVGYSVRVFRVVRCWPVLVGKLSGRRRISRETR
jgi:hypothetical protein